MNFARAKNISFFLASTNDGSVPSSFTDVVSSMFEFAQRTHQKKFKVSLKMFFSMLILSILVGRSVSALGDIYDEFSRLFERKSQLNDIINLFWTVNQADQIIEFGLIAQSTGWIGFGVSESGSMRGADIAILQKNPQNTGEIVLWDYFSEDYGVPQKDADDSQDWKLISKSGIPSIQKNFTHTAFMFQRDLFTCDDQDFQIDEKPKYVVFAIGESEDEVLSYHTRLGSRGSKLISFFFKPENNAEDDLSLPQEEIWDDLVGENSPLHVFEFKMPHLQIPRAITSYYCLPIQLNSSDVLFKRSLHVIKWVGIPRTEMIHHMFAYRCPTHAINMPWNIPYLCDSKPPECDPYIAWALGQGEVVIPENVGIPIGNINQCQRDVQNTGSSDSDCFSYFLVEFHYNNPQQLSNVVDSSGLKILFTESLRKYDMGLFVTGPAFASIDIPPKQSNILIQSECPRECSERFVHSGITVFAVQLHMHKLGKQIWIQHIRDSVELSEIARKDYYDFHKQSLTYLLPSKTILPGDRVIVNCNYGSLQTSRKTVGGWTSDDEMCAGYFGYYPRMKNIGYCGISFDNPSKAYCGPSSFSGRINRSVEWESDYCVNVSYSNGGENGVTDPSYQPLNTETHTRGVNVCHLKAYEKVNDPFEGWEQWTPVPVLFIGMLYESAKVLHFILQRLSSKYSRQPIRIQRNIQIYLISLLCLTIALLFILVGSFEIGLLTSHPKLSALISPEESESQKNSIRLILFGTTMIGFLYIFEMLYKVSIDVMLSIHHWITIFILTALTVALTQTLSLFYLKAGVWLSFNATSEQPVYIALILYRLCPQSAITRYSLQVSFISTLFLKTFFFMITLLNVLREHQAPPTIYSWQPKVHWQRWMYSSIVILTFLLYFVQIRLAKVLFDLQKKLGSHEELDDENSSLPLETSRRASTISGRGGRGGSSGKTSHISKDFCKIPRYPPTDEFEIEIQ